MWDLEVWLRGLALWLVVLLVYAIAVWAGCRLIKRWRGEAKVDLLLEDLAKEAEAEPTPAVPRPARPVPQPKDAWSYAPYDDDDVRAVKALASGKASEGQQRIALAWMIYNASRTYDLPFRPGGVDGQRASDFACGRMFVGQQVIKLINMDMPEKKKGRL